MVLFWCESATDMSATCLWLTHTKSKSRRTNSTAGRSENMHFWFLGWTVPLAFLPYECFNNRCVLFHSSIERDSFIDSLLRDRVEGALKRPQVCLQDKHRASSTWRIRWNKNKAYNVTFPESRFQQLFRRIQWALTCAPEFGSCWSPV